MITQRPQTLRAEGRPRVNGRGLTGTPLAAKIMVAQGFGAVPIDWQRGARDHADLLPVVQAMRTSGAVLLARMPWEPGIIRKALDAGACGCIRPMVNSAGEAARIMACLRYPPRGQRSFGPTRVARAAGADHAIAANDTSFGFAMFETAGGMADPDPIAVAPGPDGRLVGPADLTLSLTQCRLAPGFDREEPGLRAARATGWGHEMTTIGGDSRFLAAGAGAAVAGGRRLTGTGATR